MKRKFSWVLVALFLLMNLCTGVTESNAATCTPLAEMGLGDTITFANRSWTIIDSGTGLIMLKNNAGARPWDAYTDYGYSNDYAASDIRSYLNGEFFNSFPADDKALIQKWTWNCGPDGAEDSKTVQDKIGLLTKSEYELYKSIVRKFPFPADTNWWLITPYKDDAESAWCYRLANSTVVPTLVDNTNSGVFPVLHLESGLFVSDEGAVMTTPTFGITTDSLPCGFLGQYDPSYSIRLEAAYGTVPYTWEITGDLPAGIWFDENKGVLNGSPKDTGIYDLTVTVTDAAGKTDAVDYTLTIAQSLSMDLASLTTDPGTLSPAFDKNIVAYQVKGADNLESIKITAELTDRLNTFLKINEVYSDGGAVETVYLDQGANLIPIVVNDINSMKPRKAYVISVNGTVSDADLNSLTVSEGILDFNAETTDYTLIVDEDQDSIDVTAAPHDSKAMILLNGSIQSAGTPGTVDLDVGTNTIEVMVVAQDASTKTYTITVERQAVLAIDNTRLPIGIVGTDYQAQLTASGGIPGYTWEADADTLPAGLVLDGNTGEISGIPENEGTYNIDFMVTDSQNTQVTKSLSLKINLGCGNGGYIITPDDDTAYTSGLTEDGIPTMTVNQDVSGFKYFSVTIEPVKGHDGQEVAVFVHLRDGEQIGINAARADFDATDNAQAAFNVKAGDVIKAYIVDSLSNDPDSSPNIL